MSVDETIVDACIETLANALSSDRVTSVELVAKYLLRISTYDCRNTTLNSIPLLNENVFNEAAQSDDRRVTHTEYGPLDGIPFTVKDSYKVRGMSVASGSEAFENLIANEDAFTVKSLRNAGAVLLGKTNMCPMAYGGMIRGLYGRAESPYNSQFLAAAFGSGSSNGSGVATTASLAAFGMGEETVSSGRSPASNNALVAYTPSRGVISIRGNWPLYPTCDVVVPHTRSIKDLLFLMDVLTGKDSTTVGDFWRDQPFIMLPNSLPNRPKSFTTLQSTNQLQGKKIAVPSMYVKQSYENPYVSAATAILWKEALADLEAAGAEVEITNKFPVLQAYTSLLSDHDNESYASFGLPRDWNTTERGVLIAHAWEDFLQSNRDPSVLTLEEIDPQKIFPHLPPDDPQVKFKEPRNAVHFSKLAGYIHKRSSSSEPGKSCVYSVPQLEEAIKALEAIRKHYFETWLDNHQFDYVVFPAAGDVAKANADIDYDSAEHAWRDGVKYSHGNRMLRHLGIPSVTVPMGLLDDSMMPMGLTFLGRAYDDVSILAAAYAYEQQSHKRTLPPRTPPLVSDIVQKIFKLRGLPPELTVTRCSVDEKGANRLEISIQGDMSRRNQMDSAQVSDQANWLVQVYIDGIQVPDSQVLIENHNSTRKAHLSCQWLVAAPPTQDRRNTVVGKVARDSTMVMIIARDGEEGRPTGFLKVIHESDY